MSATSHRWHRNVHIFNYPLFSAPFAFWGALGLIGLTLSLGRFFTGLWFTGMNDDYAWGVWKTFNVMTLTALGSGGLAVAFFCYVLGKTQLHSVMRTAVASSFLFYATGMFALVIDVGRPWNMYNMAFPWTWNLHSSLFEVALCMSAYVVIFLLFENLTYVVDQAILESDTTWRGRLRKWVPFFKKLYPWMVGGALLLPAMHQSSLGALMVIAGHKVHPLWQTQMLPAFYLIQAVVCGFAAVIFILMAASLAWRRPLDIPVLSDMAKYMAWTSFVFVAIRYIDVVIRGVIGQAFEATWYAVLFHTENFLVLIPALLFLNARIRATPRALFVLATLTGVGGVLYRFTPTTLAFRVNHPSVYFPKIAELLMCLGYIGLAVILFIWVAKRFAILPATTSDWDKYVTYLKSKNPKLRINEHGAATDN
ncbi:MAG TPA: Ni/Fe-hydrogenase cytochrome b subunit [Thermoanaerobaculia bacterium]|nr:Ni/Fe-hydrogenase cytochrome b subunit [Thermoanaerobaculia bacterium]